MKSMRYISLFIGFVLLPPMLGFIFQIQSIINLWPWADGRLSYLFIGSILAAASATALWVGLADEVAALPGGSLTIFVMGATTAIYFFQPALRENHKNILFYAATSCALAIFGGVSFFLTRNLPLPDARPMPALVKFSFWVFMSALILAAGALILRIPVFPWALNPDSSVIFGCLFLGNATYFLYGLLYPRWYHALGQLLSFLAYDLVLIAPFLMLFKTIKPEYFLSLVAYILVLVYSGALSVYFVFINSKTRLRLQK